MYHLPSPCPAVLRPFPHHSTLGLPYPPSFPTHHALRPPPHPPAQYIWPACSPRGGRSVHQHVYPCADVSMAHPFGCCARTSRRVLTPGRACSPAASRGWGYGRRGCQTRSSRPSSCAPGYGGWGFRVCMHLQTSEFMVRVLGYHEDWSKFKGKGKGKAKDWVKNTVRVRVRVSCGPLAAACWSWSHSSGWSCHSRRPRSWRARHPYRCSCGCR